MAKTTDLSEILRCLANLAICSTHWKMLEKPLSSINLRNILSNCTDLVRERENRPRTCHPQRTSEPAAALAFNILSSGNMALFTVLETSLQTEQEEGSKSHLGLDHTGFQQKLCFLHSSITIGLHTHIMYCIHAEGMFVDNWSAYTDNVLHPCQMNDCWPSTVLYCMVCVTWGRT